jgi:membrane associated rhomboid family serine protease
MAAVSPVVAPSTGLRPYLTVTLLVALVGSACLAFLPAIVCVVMFIGWPALATRLSTRGDPDIYTPVGLVAGVVSGLVGAMWLLLLDEDTSALPLAIGAFTSFVILAVMAYLGCYVLWKWLERRSRVQD